MAIRSLRIFIASSLLLLAGWAIGADKVMIAIAAAIAILILLPGLFQEPAASAALESAAAAEHTPTPELFISDIYDAAILISPGGMVLAANRAAIELLGEIVGEPMRLALRQPSALDLIDTAVADKQSVTREVDGLGRQGSVHLVRASFSQGGELLVTLADISSARAAERMRTDFVANASHELRTPLASLTGFIETLQGPAADDEEARTRFLGVMADEAARMTRLIDDLLSLSRAELDKNVRPRTSVDIAALLDEFTAAMPQLPGELIVEKGPDLPPVLGDRDQLLQVLGNLVTNAFKYGGESGPVTVRATVIASALRISVSDTGEGIAAEHIPRLTERFYRVDAGRSRRMGGTGLGLAIVRHIVDRHRGRLEIRSGVGEGTIVSVSLPPVTKLQTDGAR